MTSGWSSHGWFRLPSVIRLTGPPLPVTLVETSVMTYDWVVLITAWCEWLNYSPKLRHFVFFYCLTSWLTAKGNPRHIGQLRSSIRQQTQGSGFNLLTRQFYLYSTFSALNEMETTMVSNISKRKKTQEKNCGGLFRAVQTLLGNHPDCHHLREKWN